ncbi:hypothetical protein ABH944_003798 [Caballeronia udeis]|uniref:Uncharacterized protein n=1 Tax=Caballeronia udeis TaxID=1232866 RepID=A0ABW8MIB6_9BURK
MADSNTGSDQGTQTGCSTSCLSVMRLTDLRTQKRLLKVTGANSIIFILGTRSGYHTLPARGRQEYVEVVGFRSTVVS